MASAEGIDLYTCEVCLENMLDKDPRLLWCHHSFCMKCLKKIMKNGTILCPTCRESTRVSNNDIQSLKVNFMLKKVKDHMDKMHSRKTVLCQFCLSENATLKCQECSQLICEECSEKHKIMKTFKDHQIYKLCDKHKDGMITHVCIKCVRPACAKCVMTEHFDHEAEIEKHQEGINILRQEISKYEEDVDEIMKSVSAWQDQDRKELVNIKTAIDKVKDIRAYYLEKAKEATEILENLQSKEAQGREIDKTYEKKVKECENIKTLLQRRSNDLRNGNLENFLDVKNKAEKLLDEVKQENIRLSKEQLSIFDPRRGEEIKLTGTKPVRYLETPVLEKTISCPGNQQWQRPFNISSVDSDCVIVSDFDKSEVICIYNPTSSRPSVRISSQYGYVRDACVYQDYLYTAYSGCITKRTFNNGAAGAEIKYNPNITDIYSMLVVNDSCVVLVCPSTGRVVEYNPNNNNTNVAVSNLDYPVQVRLMKREDHILYMVTCWGNSHDISVYDGQWNQLFTFGGRGNADGQLYNPWSTAYTTEGILASDMSNRRVCLFSFDGKFIKHILTNKDGINNPMGLVFLSPYLWVTSQRSSSVKCFKLCE